MGCFTGGSFLYDGVAYPLGDSLFCFNGSKPHASSPFEGTRLSFVFFNHHLAAQLSPTDMAQLMRLGLMANTPTKPLWIIQTPWDILRDPNLDVLAHVLLLAAVSRTFNCGHPIAPRFQQREAFQFQA